MFFRRINIILFCLFIALFSSGCMSILFATLGDDVPAVSDDTLHFQTPLHDLWDDLDTHDSNGAGDSGSIDSSFEVSDSETSKETEDKVLHSLYQLDISSAEAFVADVKSTYDVELKDSFDYLSGPRGLNMMLELEYALSLFTPTFIKALVAEYREYNSGFILVLGGPNLTQYGMTEWSRDLTMTLYYDEDPDDCGITSEVLAHELAHAVHFIIEEIIGETRSMMELRFFNSIHAYVGDDYEYVWDINIHGYYFAYEYGMYDHYEDFATVLEMLVAHSNEMLERLSDSRHEPLFNKTMYLRDLLYTHIAETDVFSPLYEAEKMLMNPAA